MKRILLASVFAAVPLIAATGVGHADLISIAVGFGGTPATIASGQGSVPISYSAANAQGSVTGAAFGSPLLKEPAFDTTSFDISNGASGTVYIYATEQGLTLPSGSFSILSSFTTNSLQGGASSVTESTYLDSANGLYTTPVTLGTATFTKSLETSASTYAVSALSAPYSLTQIYAVTFTGTGEANLTINMQQVPEPGSLALLGTGLVALGLLVRKRQKRG